MRRLLFAMLLVLLATPVSAQSFEAQQQRPQDVLFAENLISSSPQVPAAIASPAAEPLGAIYVLDNQHSLLDFTATHIGFGRVRGTFNTYRAAAFFVGDDVEQSTFSVVIDVSTLDTQQPGRDELLREEFFDVENHPYITFQSTRFEEAGDGYTLVGDLTMRGVTREVEIPTTVITLDGTDQWQHKRIAFEGELVLDRRDYNVIYDNDFWDAIVSNEIRIDISFGARHYNALNTIFPWRDASIGTVVREVEAEAGIDAALTRVRELWQNNREDYQFSLGQFYRAGVALGQKGQHEDAVRVLDLALELNEETADTEDKADIYATISEIQWQGGDEEAALASAERALAIDPHNPAAGELRRHLMR